MMLKRYPDFNILVVVPTITLKEQWEGIVDGLGFGLNVNVQVINTVIKNEYTIDLLVLDEIHRAGADTLSQVFNVVKYRIILGLTATFERLDGKHELIAKYCPVIDTITPQEAMANGWVSLYKEYQVLVDVDDINEYLEQDKLFNAHFEYFGCDFNVLMSCVGPKGFINRAKLRDEMCQNCTDEQRKEVFKNITYHSTTAMRALQARKKFINNHPIKIELARKIINARKDCKIITFSNNVKMAEAIGIGSVYTGKDSKKKGRMTIEEFASQKTGVLSSCSKLNEGFDCPGLSVAIVLGTDSSKIKATQRLGRVIRVEPDKQAEIFYIILNNTKEQEWFRQAHKGNPYITIDTKGLDDVLNGKEPQPYKRVQHRFAFRF